MEGKDGIKNVVGLVGEDRNQLFRLVSSLRSTFNEKGEQYGIDLAAVDVERSNFGQLRFWIYGNTLYLVLPFAYSEDSKPRALDKEELCGQVYRKKDGNGTVDGLGYEIGSSLHSYSSHSEQTRRLIRDLTLLCQCSHVILWVGEPDEPGGVPLRWFQTLKRLHSLHKLVFPAIAKFTKHEKPLNPGKCYPRVIFLLQGIGKQKLDDAQNKIKRLLSICGLDDLKGGPIRTKKIYCAVFNDSVNSAINEEPSDLFAALANKNREFFCEDLQNLIKELSTPTKSPLLFDEWMRRAQKIMQTLSFHQNGSGVKDADNSTSAHSNLGSRERFRHKQTTPISTQLEVEEALQSVYSMVTKSNSREISTDRLFQYDSSPGLEYIADH